jgi:hypothetical protein
MPVFYQLIGWFYRAMFQLHAEIYHVQEQRETFFRLICLLSRPLNSDFASVSRPPRQVHEFC